MWVIIGMINSELKYPHGGVHPQSKKVVQFTTDGQFIRVWDCINDICREFDCTNAGIISCCKGRYKSALGYIWKYYEEVKDGLAL
jgi:hypothetical protein